MRKVFQKTPFDCFNACLESVTGLEDVPFFMEKPGSWFRDARRWLRRRGFDIVYVPYKDKLDGRRYAIAAVDPFNLPNGGFATHAVVMRGGKVVHDPDRRRIKKHYEFFSAVEVRRL